MTQPALLMLDDGTCFEGNACGAGKEALGEVVFTTGMTGYQETMTDPSFYGQIVAFTAAHVGNYGTTSLDDEAPSPRAAGAVFHELFSSTGTDAFPHWRASESMDQRLKREGLTGISGVDTRALTLHLRENGAKGGIISAVDLDRPSLLRRAKELPPMRGQDLARQASCSNAYDFPPGPSITSAKDSSGLSAFAGPSGGSARYRIAVMDFGVKRSILTHLSNLHMQVRVWPGTTNAQDILDSAPDGVLLSNGPGDPEPCSYAVATIRKLLGKTPLFGICLGHQLLSLALGGKTFKLPFGHHGANHPVKDLISGRVNITSQNHGFCVDPDSLPADAEPTHWNLNDDTLEGLAVRNLPAFSVQFHPEAAPGPADAKGLFARFRELIRINKEGA